MKFLLCCSYGMSTSIMMNKMEEYARKKGIDLTVDAIPVNELQNHLEGVDLILLGPQIKYLYNRVKKIIDDKVPYAMINTEDYGMMRGDKVVEQALTLLSTVRKEEKNCD